MNPDYFKKSPARGTTVGAGIPTTSSKPTYMREVSQSPLHRLRDFYTSKHATADYTREVSKSPLTVCVTVAL